MEGEIAGPGVGARYVSCVGELGWGMLEGRGGDARAGEVEVGLTFVGRFWGA